MHWLNRLSILYMHTCTVDVYSGVQFYADRVPVVATCSTLSGVMFITAPFELGCSVTPSSPLPIVTLSILAVGTVESSQGVTRQLITYCTKRKQIYKYAIENGLPSSSANTCYTEGHAGSLL